MMTPPRRVAVREVSEDVEARMGWTRRVAPVLRRDAYVDVRAWDAVGRGGRGGFGGTVGMTGMTGSGGW